MCKVRCFKKLFVLLQNIANKLYQLNCNVLFLKKKSNLVLSSFLYKISLVLESEITIKVRRDVQNNNPIGRAPKNYNNTVGLTLTI